MITFFFLEVVELIQVIRKHNLEFLKKKLGSKNLRLFRKFFVIWLSILSRLSSIVAHGLKLKLLGPEFILK